MNAVLVIATAVATVFLLLPVALVWFINIGGIIQAVKERQKVTEPEKATC
jgi:hypothetical protein